MGFAMRHSLRSRLWLLFLAFLLLVVGSVTITFVALNAQHADALSINLAGRQRMLSQQMTWLALTAPDGAALAAARQRFAQTLHALRAGGTALDPADLPVVLLPQTDPAAQARLAEVAQAWQRFDRELARQPAGGAPPLDASLTDASLTEASLALLDRLDAAVSRMAQVSQAKVRRLQAVQALFLALALWLLYSGYRLTQRRLVTPLAALDAAAQRMAAGDLEQAISPLADAELNQLAAALEAMRVEVLNSRRHLEERVGQRTRELSTAFELSQEVTAQLELDRLLTSATDRARTLLHGEAAALCLLDNESAMLHLAAGSGRGQASPALRQPVSAPLAGQVVGQGKTVVAQTACASCGFLRGLADSQCVATPLRAGSVILGALCVARPVDTTFEAEEQSALALLANAAAGAIVNARLVEARRTQAQQMAAQQERERLAAELHDNLAQTLSFLNFKVDRLEELVAAGAPTDAARELAQMRSATTKAYQQVRSALTGLRAPTPQADALAAQLAGCVDEMRATGLPVTLHIDDEDALALPAIAQQQVIHIVREALTNVWRHAGAGRATVCAERVDGSARFTIQDDGCGFDPATVDGSAHLGLAIMRARAERSGGSLAVHSQPGQGTRVVVSFTHGAGARGTAS
ncbi:MAG: hypothetical protein DCC57_16925 [Chloroflexi bacterium]|nr:MAG: hypothetical protein DCC57_16925 [Chloroflexota bacterium]